VTAAPSVDVFRAVADPTRRALLDRLHDAEQSVTDLAGPFRMTQPAISAASADSCVTPASCARARSAASVYRLDARPRDVFAWASLYRDLFTDPSGHAWRITKRP
jgi:DNA-binding transcriptional ArsR family regulator